jgi:quercetin dioxygenase-like cupin family protein
MRLATARGLTDAGAAVVLADVNEDAVRAAVTYEPGARTAWHTHPLGQTLLVTAGVGRVANWGEAPQEIRPGDVVWIPSGQKHWHGAVKHFTRLLASVDS